MLVSLFLHLLGVYPFHSIAIFLATKEFGAVAPIFSYLITHCGFALYVSGLLIPIDWCWDHSQTSEWPIALGTEVMSSQPAVFV